MIILLAVGFYVYMTFFYKKIKLIEPNYIEVAYHNTASLLNVKPSLPEFYTEFSKVNIVSEMLTYVVLLCQ